MDITSILQDTATMSYFLIILAIICGLFRSPKSLKYTLYYYPLRHMSTLNLKEINIKNDIQCVNGLEFNNGAFQTFCNVNGLQFRFSCPHTSSQNGKAERKIKSTNNIYCSNITCSLLYASIFLVSRPPNGHLSPQYSPYQTLRIQIS